MSFKNIRLMPTPEEIKKMEPISPELKAIKDENDKQLKEKWFNTTRYGSRKNVKMLHKA